MVKPQSEKMAGKKFNVFTAKTFTSQVVAGRNFFIKVKPQAEKMAGKKFNVFTAKTFTSQVVAGRNFFIKFFSRLHQLLLTMMTMVGGPDPVMDATPDVQHICEKVKPQAEKMAGKKFNVFTAKTFTSQVVAGRNFFIKVHVGGDEYVHLRVYRSLPCAGEKLELHGLQSHKTRQDPVGYF